MSKNELVYKKFKCDHCDLEHNSLPRGILNHIATTKHNNYVMEDIIWQGNNVNMFIECDYDDNDIHINWKLIKCNTELVLDRDNQIVSTLL